MYDIRGKKIHEMFVLCGRVAVGSLFRDVLIIYMTNRFSLYYGFILQDACFCSARWLKQAFYEDLFKGSSLQGKL